MSPILRSAIVYAFLFGSIGAYFPYIAVFYRSIGLSLEAVGLLAALGAAVGLVAAPAWGALADRSVDRRGPIVLAGSWAALAAAWLAVAREPLPVAAATALLGAGSAGIGPMLDSLTIERLGERADRFGRARAWGSAAFIVVSLLTGTIVERIGPPGLFLLFAPGLLLTSLSAYALLGGSPSRRRAVTLSPLQGLAGILRHPSLRTFLLGSILVWTAVGAVATFVSVHLFALGASGEIVGLVWALGALVEVPLMLLFPSIVRRYGTERLLVFGALAFAVRAAGWALAGVPLALVAVAPLGGIGFGLFYVATVGFVARAVPPEVQATAQGVFSGTAFSTGAILGSLLGGLVAGALGLPALFAIASILTILAAVIVWWAIVATRGPASRAAARPGG